MLNTVNMIIQLENSYGFPTVEKKRFTHLLTQELTRNGQCASMNLIHMFILPKSNRFKIADVVRLKG